MKKVIFQPSGQEVLCNHGDNLLEVARRANVFIDAPCNGSVSCGKCRVKLLRGKVRPADNIERKAFKLEPGYISACHSEVVEDIEINVPTIFAESIEEMRIDDLSREADLKLFEIAKNYITDSGLTFTSYVRKDYLEIVAPSLDDYIADWARLKRHLKVHLGYKNVFCRLPILRKLPQLLRQCDFCMTITHIPRGSQRTTIINMEPGDTTSRLYGVAVDIGTTSVAAFLVDMHEGELLAKASSGNAQIQYGADVINRIIYAAQDGGLEKLSTVLVHDTINPILHKMLSDAAVARDEVIAFVAAGNTTMSHLLLGIYPDYLRREPYVPAFVQAPFIKASELEIAINPETFLYLVPSISSYVGGDITAGVLSSGIWLSSRKTLFIDLGTNGEIVYGNLDFLLTCACSAGPAFEGGGISCGMRASYGAIEKVTIPDTTSTPVLTVIGGGKPLGICGSGIIDLIAELLSCGIINRKGKMNRHCNSNRIRFDEYDNGEFVVAFAADAGLERDLVITEVDIDSFIRTKGAIYSGAATLIRSIGDDFSMVDKVYIAGGIGNSLDIEKSIRIGLLPDIERSRFAYIGNSSLMGCYLTLLSEDARKTLEKIAANMTCIELSVYPDYMDEFISACFLPHTNLQLFPSTEGMGSL